MKMVGYYPSVLSDLGFLSIGDENNFSQKAEAITAMALAVWECLIKNSKVTRELYEKY